MCKKISASLVVATLAGWAVPTALVAVSIVPDHDNTLLGATGQENNNNGGSSPMIVGNQGDPGTSDNEYLFVIARWEPATLGTNLAAGNGSLTLKVDSEAGTFDNHIIDLYAIDPANAGWNEGTSTWNEKVSTTDTAWTPGPGLGVTPGNGGYGPLLDSFTWDGSATFSMTVPQSVINDWIQNPSNNAGILLRDRENPGDADNRLRLYSSEDAQNAPVLSFEAIPEPTSLCLFGAAALMVSRRRRRA